MSQSVFDLIVLGGGPGGYSAAITAAKRGLNVLLCEKERVGGTCLNAGCIPAKYLLDKASAMERVRALTDEGIFKDAGLFSFKKIQSGRRETIDKLVSGVQSLLKSNRVAVEKGEAALLSPRSVVCGEKTYEGRSVIIATGSTPARIPVPGAELAVDSTAVLAFNRVPARLAVIGGGVIGLELASAYRAFGSEVTVVEVMNELFPTEERAIVRQLQREIENKGIRILLSTKLEKIEKTAAGLRLSCVGGDGPRVIEAGEALMATGRKPNLSGIDAKALGLKLGKLGEIQTNGFMETSLPGVYAIGDVAGGYQLAHAAYAEAETAVDRILGGSEPVDMAAIPRCVYTDPMLSSVGLSSEKARELGIEPAIGNFSYSANGMALAEGARGCVRVVMDKNARTTIGVQILGPCASELIAFAALAVAKKLSLADWRRTIVAHPSLSEMIKEAALDCFKESVHLL